MHTRNEQMTRVEDQIAEAAARIAPQFRHLLLDIAKELGARHPHQAAPAVPRLRLVGA